MTEKPQTSAALDAILKNSPIDKRAMACDITLANRLKEMTDREVVAQMPQLVERGPDGATRFSPKVDFGGVKGVVENTEIRAALAMAVKIAKEQGIKVSEVNLDALSMKEGCAIALQLSGDLPSPKSCAIPPKPTRER
jgi:hypothetical protein